MYPYFRSTIALIRGYRDPKMDITEPVFSTHRAWPGDTDMFGELNHGRILTLFELGRWRIIGRMGLLGPLIKHRIAFGIAGVSVRYRKRVKLFAKYRMQTQYVGWDDRFIYAVQSMWLGNDCAHEMLIRIALRSPKGTIPPDDFLKLWGREQSRPELPDWVAAWIAAEKQRPWPPEDLSIQAS